MKSHTHAHKHKYTDVREIETRYEEWVQTYKVSKLFVDYEQLHVYKQIFNKIKKEEKLKSVDIAVIRKYFPNTNKKICKIGIEG